MSSNPDFGSRTDFYTFAPESLAEVLPAFEIQREVGQGSMGLVYEAIVREDGRRVALKVLPPSLTLTERALARFMREGEIMSKIRHPGIVEVYDLGHRDRLHYFVMEFVDGVNLEDRLAVGPLPYQQVAEIGCQVARALQFAHDRGVVHRDVKPSNLILRENGDVAITDFGLARETGTGSMTESGAIVGTPMFMAPEQVTGERSNLTSRADVYGLGSTLYTLVTGRPPFEGPSAQQVLRQVLDQTPPRANRLRADLPRDLEAIIATAMEKEPERRYATASELGDDLQRFLDGKRVHARLPGPIAQLGRLVRKHQLLTTLSLLVVTLTVLALWLIDTWRAGEIEAELARASGLVAQAVSRHDEQLKPIDESQRRDRLNSAIAAASNVIGKDPSNARAWFVRGQAYHHLRRFREACLDLNTAETHYGGPTPEVLHYRIDARGNLFDRESRLELQRDLRSLLDIDPSPYNRCIVAFHLLDLARSLPEDARDEILTRAGSIVEPVPDPDAAKSVIAARILDLRGEHDRALRAIRDATEKFHGDALVHDEAAEMLQRRGFPDESEAQAELARIIDPRRAAEREAPTPGRPERRSDLGDVQEFLRDLQELLQGSDKGEK